MNYSKLLKENKNKKNQQKIFKKKNRPQIKFSKNEDISPNKSNCISVFTEPQLLLFEIT